MEQFDTLPIQCRHIEHMHEGVWFGKIVFVCTDSTETFFSKLRSAGLKYNLPSFFTDSRGVSNKHCLLTFYIIPSANFVCGGYTVFTLSMCASVRNVLFP